MPAVGCSNAEASLAAGLYAMLLHQTLNAQLAHTNATLLQLAPDTRPSVGSAMLLIRNAIMDHQRFIALVPPRSYLPPPRQMLMKAGDAHAQYSALHIDRPEPPITFNKGKLHFWPFASRVARRNFASALSQNWT